MKSMLRPLPLILAASLLAGCNTFTPKSSPIPLPRNEFASTDTFSRPFPGTPAAACEAARRTLLSQGYVVADATSTELTGRKKFQPEPDAHLQIEFHVVCAADSRGSNSTTVFANAVRDRYTLKKANTSASVGVGGLGSLSVPIGLSDDSMVKVGSETIPAKEFYEGFFSILERFLDVPAELTTTAAPAGTPTGPEPAAAKP